jgi:hypothetical protein
VRSSRDEEYRVPGTHLLRSMGSAFSFGRTLTFGLVRRSVALIRTELESALFDGDIFPVVWACGFWYVV